MYKTKPPGQGKEDERELITSEAQASAHKVSVAQPDHVRDGPNVGTYGQQSITVQGNVAGKDEITSKNWHATDHCQSRWGDDPKSRLAIRMGSRGILGAAFFTAGGLLTKKMMNGEHVYDATASLSRQKNPLQVIAKLVDMTVGTAVQGSVTAIAGKEAGLRAVHFRPTRYKSFGKEMRGRSLGDEVVNITFDFFCASVGDAWGRDIAGIIDPSTRKCWQDEKGHFSIPKATQKAVDGVVRYVTYNGGEDWAVAIPYAYFMKGQRRIVENASPGFKYDFDHGLNGGSFRMDKEHKIVGNYNLPGIADLQSRFTAYNIGTLMYREVFHFAKNVMEGKPASLYGAPDQQDPHKGVLGKAGDVMKWAARSAVKGVVVMTPAVPFFWISRTPQTKHRGLFLDPELGPLGPTTKGNAVGSSLHANTPDLSPSTYVDHWQYTHKPGEPDLRLHRNLHPGLTISQLDPTLAGTGPQGGNTFNAHLHTHGYLDSSLNMAGKVNYKLAHEATKRTAWVDNVFPTANNEMRQWLGIGNSRDGRFVRPMVYASVAYTPYMYAKAEFSNLWDNGKMDMSAERMIDGATKLNWGEFKKGAHEVYRSILQRPLEDPLREQEAQRRLSSDTSPADVFTKTQAEQAVTRESKLHKSGDRKTPGEQISWGELKKGGRDIDAQRQKVLHGTAPGAAQEKAARAEKGDWRDRVISGPPVEKKILAEHDEKKTMPQKKASYAEQEEMRLALEKLAPPTNAIN